VIVEAVVSAAFDGSLIDTSKPHAARRYDYLLGGKDNFAADRESAKAYLTVAPHLRTWARENRAFMRRAVAYLAETGVRQFLDIGTGIPTSPNLHEVVQGIAPESRVVYADKDPIVLVHARALLTSSPEGRTAYLDADLAEPEDLLARPEIAEILDFSRPVALSLIAVVHFFKDAQDPYSIVTRLLDALPSGSYLAMSHNSWDYFTPEKRAILEPAVNLEGQCRTREEFERFFTGLELVEPGVTLISEWRRAGNQELPRPDEVSAYGAVARKP
jgi:hypothetical protein